VRLKSAGETVYNRRLQKFRNADEPPGSEAKVDSKIGAKIEKF
jgi:hypothetical protein